MDFLKKMVTKQKEIITQLLGFPEIEEKRVLNELLLNLDRFELELKKPSIYDYFQKCEDSDPDEKLQDPEDFYEELEDLDIRKEFRDLFFEHYTEDGLCEFAINENATVE